MADAATAHAMTPSDWAAGKVMNGPCRTVVARMFLDLLERSRAGERPPGLDEVERCTLGPCEAGVWSGRVTARLGPAVGAKFSAIE